MLCALAESIFYRNPMTFSTDSAQRPRRKNNLNVQNNFSERFQFKNRLTFGMPSSYSISVVSHWPIKIRKEAGLTISTLSSKTGSCMLINTLIETHRLPPHQPRQPLPTSPLRPLPTSFSIFQNYAVGGVGQHPPTNRIEEFNSALV